MGFFGTLFGSKQSNAHVKNETTVSKKQFLDSRTMLYRSVDDTLLPFTDDMFDSHIVAHTYERGWGRIVFDKPVTECGFWQDAQPWNNWELRRRIRHLVLPSKLQVLRERAMYDCHRLENICLPGYLRKIGEAAFTKCKKLSRVWMPDSVVSIGDEAFSDCYELSQVRMSKKVSHIGYRTFYCCGFSHITLPNRLAHIGYMAFAGCKGLKELTLPESLKSIEERAFSQCDNLSSIITIPNRVARIDDRVFEGCEKVTGFYGKHTSSDHRAIIVNGALKAFTAVGLPSMYAMTIPKGVTSIGDNVFSNRMGLSQVTLPDGVTSIGAHAFAGCENLQCIVIPDSMTSIGSGAFEACRLLQHIVIPDGVTSIGAYAFAGCESLQSIVIPDSVTVIGSFAVGDCQLVVVGRHVKNMQDAFQTKRVSWKRTIVFTAPIDEDVRFEIPATKVYFPMDAMPDNTHRFRSCRHTSEVEVIGYHPSELESIIAQELAAIQTGQTAQCSR